MKKYIIAVLEFVDCDDSMITVKTDLINGYGKEQITALHEKCCISLNKELIDFLMKNWDKWCKSPEYALYKKLEKIKKENYINLLRK